MRPLLRLVGEGLLLHAAQRKLPKGPASPWQPQRACSFQRLCWQQSGPGAWNGVLVTDAGKCENGSLIDRQLPSGNASGERSQPRVAVEGLREAGERN